MSSPPSSATPAGTAPDPARVAGLVREALELGPRERVAFVRRRAGADVVLFDAVMARLLEQSDVIAALYERSAGDDWNDTDWAGGAAAHEPPDRSGERVGPYRLVSRIGMGGMGAVYLAVRDDATFSQRVAIKLVNEGLYGPLTAGRLRAERQMLATLDHPNIARLLDGGTAGDGTPYFVMEHVDGEPLDVYCDSRRLDTAARLTLFRSICAAVQCAHQNLIVHRDLKPSNILVTADGVPKLLDFGIAKLLDATRASHTVAVTQASMRLMTPNYASPEQVAGGPITTATDIYALGLLLYELLTGRKPFVITQLALADIQRVLTTTPVQAPSAAVLCGDLPGREAGPRRALIAEARSTAPSRLARTLRGDLDVIVLKALQVEPERRYASAEQFARDVGHFLEGRPIVAQRDTWGYRARKFVARYRVAVTAASAFVLLLASFAATLAIQASRIAAERDRATAEEARAEAVSSFLVELFQMSDPGRSRGATVTAREILDAGARRVTEGLKDQPVMQSTLLETIGRVYGNLGLFGSAENAARQVLALRGATDSPDTVAALSLLGEALLEQGDYVGAEARLAEALAMQRRLAGPGTVAEAALLHIRGRVRQLEGQYAAAEALYRESLALHAAAPAGGETAVSSVLNDLAQILERRADLNGAVAMTREALATDRRLLGDDHPRVGIQLHNLAYYLLQQGDLAGSGPLFEEALALFNRVLGSSHPDTIGVLGSYGRYLQRSGRLDEAEAVLRDALARQIELRGRADYEVAYDRVSLGLLLEERRAYPSAEAEFDEARGIFLRTLPADHQYLASALTGLGRVLVVSGRPAAAETHLTRALEIWQAQLPPEHPQVAVTRAALGKALTDTGRRGEGIALLDQAYNHLREAWGEAHPDTRRAEGWLSEVMRAPQPRA